MTTFKCLSSFNKISS